MSLLQIAPATPELISAYEPSLISTVKSVPPYLGVALYGIVAIMAVITIWQTVKLYKPELVRL